MSLSYQLTRLVDKTLTCVLKAHMFPTIATEVAHRQRSGSRGIRQGRRARRPAPAVPFTVSFAQRQEQGRRCLTP